MSPWNEFKKNILSRKALSASPEVIEALNQRQANFIMRLGTSQRIQYLWDTAVNASYSWFYVNSPAVRTVVDLLANNVSQLDLRLYEEVDIDQREQQPDHPAAYALRYPNPRMSSDQFIRYMFKSWLLYDNAFAAKVRGDGGRLAFVFIPPERVKIQGRGLVPEYYVVINVDGSEQDPIPADDMFHWRGENFIDPRIGTSRLETLRSVIAEEAAMQSAIVELAKSGLTEPAYVKRPLEAPEWSNEARERFEEDISNRLRKSTSIPPVMEEGMELQGMGVSPKDAQMLEVRKYALQQVATLFNIPLGMVGLADDVGAAQSEFYADTLPPLCESFCRQLNLQVLQDEYSVTDYYFEFDLNEKLMGDERLKTLTSAAGVPPLLRNEARAQINLPPVEGGDEPMTPANMLPGSDPEALLSRPATNPPGSKPSNDVMPIQNPAGPDQGGGAREGDPGVKPSTASLEEVIVKHLTRMATKQNFDLGRANRELSADFKAAGLNGDANLAANAINLSLMEELKDGDRDEVFNRMKAGAWNFAARFGMSLEQLKELHVPEEMLWERAGFSKAKIDEMRALKLAEVLGG